MSALPIPFGSGLNAASKQPPRLLDKGKLPQYLLLNADVVTESAPNVVLAQSIQQGVISAWPGQANLIAMDAGTVNRIPPVETSESAEVRWLRENSSTLRDYQGQWLLISGDTLIAHSSDFCRIRAAVAERGIVSPFVYYVPTKEEANFVLI